MSVSRTTSMNQSVSQGDVILTPETVPVPHSPTMESVFETTKQDVPSTISNDVEMVNMEQQPQEVKPEVIRKPRRLSKTPTSSAFNFKAAMRGLSTEAKTPEPSVTASDAFKKELEVTTFQNGKETTSTPCTTPSRSSLSSDIPQEKRDVFDRIHKFMSPENTPIPDDPFSPVVNAEENMDVSENTVDLTRGDIEEGFPSIPVVEVENDDIDETTKISMDVDAEVKEESIKRTVTMKKDNIDDLKKKWKQQNPVEKKEESVDQPKVEPPQTVETPKVEQPQNVIDLLPEGNQDAHQVTKLEEPVEFKTGNQTWSMSEIEGENTDNCKNRSVKVKFTHPRYRNDLHVTITDKKGCIAKPNVAPPAVVDFLQQQPIYHRFCETYLHPGDRFLVVGA